MIPFGFMKRNATATFDPATLSLTGWWRADSATGYTAGSWLANASAGSSGSNGNMTQATGANQPAVGSALNGHNPPDGDGSNDSLANANALSTFIGASAFTYCVLFNADTAVADPGAGNRWNAPTLLADASGWSGCSFTAGGVHGYAYGTNSAELTIACATGGWHLFQVTGAASGTVRGRVDSGGFSTVATGVTLVSVMTALLGCFARGGTNCFDGRIAEIMTANTVLSDTNLDNIKSYVNTRYGLSL
jgi:hypothetical protein